VPLVLAADDLTRPLVDATANLAQRCVRYARRLEALPAGALPAFPPALLPAFHS
jgi:aspartate racemase